MMAQRKTKLRRPMATALSLQEYLTYFLLKNDAKTESKATSHSLLVATVYKSEPGCGEIVIYSRRITGGKNADPVSQFVVDMTGNTGSVSNGGNLSRTSSLLDVNSDTETQLPNNSSVNIDILASRSPSKVGAEELQRLLDHCKRNSIKVAIQFTFAHPFSWDNKYNKEGIQHLHERGVKLKPLSFQQGLNMLISDLHDTLETLDELQTCRGTISINYHMLKRAAAKFRDSLNVKSDFYFQDNEEKLQEILGYQNGLPTYKSEQLQGMTSFSLLTYRDYFLLQNTDEIWAKVNVNLSKLNNGVTQEESLFDNIYHSAEPKHDKRSKNNNITNPLGKQQLTGLVEKLWKLIGDNITLRELANNDEIVVNISTVISEYPDRMGWYDALRTLHRHLTDRIHDTGMKKVRVESTIRYAMNISTSAPGSTSGRSTPSVSSGQSSKLDEDRFGVECMHIQDILFDMLEDLEDNLTHLGKIDYGRGANLKVDKSMLSVALGLLNKATTIQTNDGEMHSMNSDFADEYSESMNHV